MPSVQGESTDQMKDTHHMSSPADMIEYCSERLSTRIAHYLFANPETLDEKLAIVREFVEWCQAEGQWDLDAPRSPDGKSSRQRRAEASEDGGVLPTDPAELYALKEQLARLMVLGPWAVNGDATCWERPEAGRNESRVSVWLADRVCDLEDGWYFRLGFGVMGIAGVSGTTPFATAEECMAAVDERLAQVESIIFA